MYDRLMGIYNEEELSYLNNRNILLIGIGGVGSPCFECLIRSGVQNITIVDFDKYELSNLNRQLGSSLNTIGMNKTSVLKSHASLINPDIKADIINEFYDENSKLNFNDFDFIIDACDNIKAKVNIITSAINNGVKVITSCGIGNRINPSLIKIEKLSKTFNDPLARVLRKSLPKNIDIPVLFSTELPIKSEKICSYMPVTMCAGSIMADYVIRSIISEYRENRE